jgi:hypothetical protein
MLDRIIDLFQGFNDPETGKEETRLVSVIWNNFSYKLFLELIVGFGPYWLNINKLHTI